MMAVFGEAGGERRWTDSVCGSYVRIDCEPVAVKGKKDLVETYAPLCV